MNREKAEKWFREHNYDFTVDAEIPMLEIRIYCTTEDAVALSGCLAHQFHVTAVHPEFAGWTVEEIMANLEDDV